MGCCKETGIQGQKKASGVIMKNTKEQIAELRTIDNVSDLIKVYKRMIYLSNISYSDIIDSLPKKVNEMVDTMTQ